MSDFPPISDLIPHRGAAILLSDVLAHDADETRCTVLLEDSMQYVSQGRADAALALELMAQAVAVHVGLQRRWSSGIPRAGYVVGVPRMDFFGGDYRVGEQLEVVIHLDFHEGPIGRFHGRVSSAGQTRAEGTLTVFEPPLDPNAGQGDDRVDGAS